MVAEILTNEGISTPPNKSKWQYAVADSILQNKNIKIWLYFKRHLPQIS